MFVKKTNIIPFKLSNKEIYGNNAHINTMFYKSIHIENKIKKIIN